MNKRTARILFMILFLIIGSLGLLYFGLTRNQPIQAVSQEKEIRLDLRHLIVLDSLLNSNAAASASRLEQLIVLEALFNSKNECKFVDYNRLGELMVLENLFTDKETPRENLERLIVLEALFNQNTACASQE